MGSFPAARSISIVKALLSQVPPNQTPSILGLLWKSSCTNRAQPSSFTPLCPSLGLPWPGWGTLGSAPTARSSGWRLAYRAQEGMQSQAPATGRASYSVIHLHRDQAEIHYSRLCIRPNKVKQPCLTEKTAPPCLYLPATVLCNPTLELGSETTQIT